MDGDPDVRKAAVYAITEVFKQRKIILLICNSLHDLSYAANLVYTIQTALPLLQDFIKNGNSNVRYAAASVVSGLFRNCITLYY